MGDKVYYKRPDNEEWKGPGRIIGQDGKIVFVRHGGVVVRVHVCWLQKSGERQDALRNISELPGAQPKSSGEPEMESRINVDSQSDHDVDTGAKLHPHSTPNIAVQDQESNPIDSNKIRPGQCITFQIENQSDKVTARVISHAGKATRKCKHWYNLEYPNGERESESVDLSKIHKLEIQETPGSNEELPDEVMICGNVAFADAKDAELANWRNHAVYEEILDEGQKCITTRWVLSLKEDDSGIIPKASKTDL